MLLMSSLGLSFLLPLQNQGGRIELNETGGKFASTRVREKKKSQLIMVMMLNYPESCLTFHFFLSVQVITVLCAQHAQTKSFYWTSKDSPHHN